MSKETFFVTDQVDRIKFGDEYWADIKRVMNTYDHKLLEVSYMEPDLAKGKLKLVSKEELAENEITLLLINIKAWNFPSDKKKGEVMPISRETVKRLDDKISTKLAVEIGKRNPVPKV